MNYRLQGDSYQIQMRMKDTKRQSDRSLLPVCRIIPNSIISPVTTATNSPSCEPKLTAKNLWTGILRVADTPQECAPYVSKCEVLSRNGHALERKLTMANGAVHKGNGEIIYQDVCIADSLLVEAKPEDTAAKTTFLLSYHDSATVSTRSTDISFTVTCGSKLKGIEAGSPEAERIQKEYSELARKACTSTMEQIRERKKNAQLAVWARAEGSVW